ncbi:MAG: RibD family protein [Pseudorhizobium sp.]
MQLAKMTDPVWGYIRSLRDNAEAAPVQHFEVSDGSVSLYRPIAVRGRPFVLAQVGQSLDGRVATPTGDAQDVSGCDGIAHLHRCRALVDAVLVGVGTVVADDPSLSVRAVAGCSPVRVVIDCNARLPENAKMLSDGGTPVLIIQADDVPARTLGDKVIALPRRGEGLHPRDILDCLLERGLSTILVEGGATTIARFIDAGLVDRLHIAVAPIIIGSGPMGISLAPIDHLAEAHRPKVDVYNIGTDIVFDCNFRATAASSERFEKAEDIPVAHPA